MINGTVLVIIIGDAFRYLFKLNAILLHRKIVSTLNAPLSSVSLPILLLLASPV